MLAFSNHLMEHLHPDDATEQIQNVNNALAPGGIYICTTPNRILGPHDVSAYFDDIAKGFHLKEYTNAELANMMEAAGFSKVRVLLRGRGLRLPFSSPVFVFRWLEHVVSSLPTPLTRRMNRPIKLMLGGVNLIGTK